MPDISIALEIANAIKSRPAVTCEYVALWLLIAPRSLNILINRSEAYDMIFLPFIFVITNHSDNILRFFGKHFCP